MRFGYFKKKKSLSFKKWQFAITQDILRFSRLFQKRSYKELHLCRHSQGDYFEGGTTHLDELVLAY